MQFLLGLLLLSATCQGYASKTDIIVLDDGTRLIGDIKQLKRGLMEVSTNNMGTVQVEWDTVIEVYTVKNYTVELGDGRRAFGSIDTSDDKLDLIISEDSYRKTLAKDQVVAIQRVKDTFISRWDGEMGLGLSAKKANQEIALVATLDAGYRTYKNFYKIDIYSSFSDRENSALEERYNALFLHSAFIATKWYSLEMIELEHNTELNLRLRTLLSGGGSYHLLRDTRNRLALSTGLALNDEQYFTSALNQISAEAFFSLDYDFFKFKTPKMDFRFNLTIFPSLTEDDRYRTALDTKVSLEMIKDFWFDISLYYIADSNPPSQDALEGGNEENPSSTDWGLNTSLRFKF